MSEYTPTTLVLNRNATLITTKGHTIKFEKDVPVHVPPIVYQEALGFGAVPPAGLEVQVRDPAPAERAPVDPAERAALILAAIEKLFRRNERYDFSAAGTPTPEAVSKAVEFRVPAAEISKVMEKYHLKRAEQAS